MRFWTASSSTGSGCVVANIWVATPNTLGGHLGLACFVKSLMEAMAGTSAASDSLNLRAGQARDRSDGRAARSLPRRLLHAGQDRC